MRLRRFIILAGYFVCAAALFTAWRIHETTPSVFARPTSPYHIPIIPSDFRGQISYLSKIHPGKYDTDDGPTVYLKHHRSGWDDCLLHFHNEWCDFTQAEKWHAMDDASDAIPWLIGAPPHIVKARRDGWLSCTEKITQLTKDIPANELRKSLRVPNYSILIACIGILAMVASATAQLRLRKTA